MDIKTINPKMKQKEIAKEVGYSSSTLQPYKQRYKNAKYFRLNNPKRTPKISIDRKRPQMASKDANENKKAFTP